MTRNLLTLKNYSQDEIYRLLSKALECKRKRARGAIEDDLKGKTVALIFNKPSTRTRVSFEAAISHLGGDSIYLTSSDLQLGRGETIEDTGKVLSRYCEAIVIRTFSHADVEALAEASSIPVINALTNDHHPCQALADLMTILEKKDRLASVDVAYIGDGNNVCNSLMIAAAKVGINLTVATPKGYEPDKQLVEEARSLITGVNGLSVTNDPKKAAKGADVIYTDVWTSMGQEEETKKRQKDFRGFQVDEKLLSLADKEAIVMHCLPAHRGEEISAGVIDGPSSVVFDQAENRLHVQKALIKYLIADGKK